MADSRSADAPNPPISSVKLIYSSPKKNTQNWLESLDYCTKLIMEVKEDQLLYGYDPHLERELLEMESMGIIPFEDEEDMEEE